MPVITTQPRNAPLARGKTATHLFIVGQSVRLKAEFMVSASKSSGIYRITRTLPPEGNLVQYRIRNDEEPHERVANQDSLEAIRKPQSESDSVFINGTLDRESEKREPAMLSLSAASARKRS